MSCSFIKDVSQRIYLHNNWTIFIQQTFRNRSGGDTKSLASLKSQVAYI